MPNQIDQLERCEPIYESLPGWQSDISEAKAFSELPEAAQAYVARLEDLIGVPVSIVLVGREREQSIVR